MTFPTIPTVAAGRVLTTNQTNTTATRTFPAMSGLTKNSGDLLIAIAVAYQTGTGTNAAFSGWSDGFTEFHDSATSTTMAIGCAYKWSTGSETAAPTVTQAGTITGHASLILLSIPGAHASTPPEAGGRASGTTSVADPTSVNPTGWDVEDTLWISVIGSGMTSGTGSWTGTGSTAPTNYTDWVDTNKADGSTVGEVEAAVAFRQSTAASEDAGPASGVDTSNARSAAIVIAVRPAPTVTNLTVQDATHAHTAENGTVTPVGDWTVLATDTFTDTDGTLLKNHVSDTGQQWNLTGVQECTILSNRATFNTHATSTDHYLILAGGTNHTLGVKIEVDYDVSVLNGGNTKPSVSIGVNYQSTALFDNITIQMDASATAATITGNGSISGTLTGHPLTGRLTYEMVGTAVSVKVDGVEVATLTRAAGTNLGSRVRLGLGGMNPKADNYSAAKRNAATPVDLVVQGATHGHTAETPTLVQESTLTVQGATQAHTAGAPTLTQVHVLAAQDATHGHTAGSPTLVQESTLAPAAATHAQSVDSPTLTQVHVLAAQDATQASTSDAVTLTQQHALTVAGATQAQTADAVALVVDLAVAAATQAVTSGSPALTQQHTLAVQGATHQHTAEAPALVVDLAVQDATHGHTAATPTLTQQHELAVAGSTHGHTADTVVLAEPAGLVVADATHAQTAGAPALTQQHELVAQGATHAHTADALALAQVHQLDVDGASHAQASELVALQVALHVQDATHQATSGVPTLVQQHTLVVADATHGQTATAPALVVDLAPNPATHTVTSGSPTLTQQHTLAAQDATHGLSSDTVALVVDLVVGAAQQAITSGTPTLTQVHVLQVDDATHGHTASDVVLSAPGVLGAAGAHHDHTVDNVDLTQIHQLTVHAATHAHTADQAAITSTSSLTVADATHAHTADPVTPTQTHILTVAGSTHAQTAGAPALTQDHTLVVDGAYHTTATVDLALLQDHQLAVDGANHTQTVAGVTLTLGTPRRDINVLSVTPRQPRLVLAGQEEHTDFMAAQRAQPTPLVRQIPPPDWSPE